MVVVGLILGFVFKRFIPVVVLSLAVFVGWLSQEPHGLPDGRLYATVIPLIKGYLPPPIVGHGRMVGTPPVPDDFQPLPRPANEMFVTLQGTKDQMPMNGLGMCCRPTAYDDVLVERSVLWFLLQGGRLIDGAQLYLNHEAIGKAIQTATSKYGIPRSEIFIVTKLPPSNFGYNTTQQVVPTFLEELQLDYVDLVLMHAPAPFAKMFASKECKDLSNKQCRQDTWKALSELQQRGIVKNVGVSNFEAKHLKDLQELIDERRTEVIAKIATNQIQFNPWMVTEWADSAAYCKEHGIGIMGWNTLGGSLSQHKSVYDVKMLTDLAEKYGRTVAQIMLRWAMQMGAVVIPGTGNPKYMKENLAIYEFELTDEEMKSITQLREEEPGKITSMAFQME